MRSFAWLGLSVLAVGCAPNSDDGAAASSEAVSACTASIQADQTILDAADDYANAAGYLTSDIAAKCAHLAEELGASASDVSAALSGVEPSDRVGPACRLAVARLQASVVSAGWINVSASGPVCSTPSSSACTSACVPASNACKTACEASATATVKCHVPTLTISMSGAPVPAIINALQNHLGFILEANAQIQLMADLTGPFSVSVTAPTSTTPACKAAIVSANRKASQTLTAAYAATASVKAALAL